MNLLTRWSSGALPSETRNLIKHSRRLVSTDSLRNTFGGSPEGGTAVYVLAEVPVFDFEHYVGVDNSLINSSEPHQAVARRLRDHPEVDEKLIRIANAERGLHDSVPTPFVMLENSAETGRHKWRSISKPVEYVTCFTSCAAHRTRTNRYTNLIRSGRALSMCAEEDAMDTKFGSLEDFDHICPDMVGYSFLAAASVQQIQLGRRVQ
nr:hypothetical protein KRP22_7290 [Phytophthora ramorum]